MSFDFQNYVSRSGPLDAQGAFRRELLKMTPWVDKIFQRMLFIYFLIQRYSELDGIMSF